LYHYRAGEQLTCLRELGYEISDPPSEQVFIDEYHRTGGWNPRNDIIGTLSEADAACPQTVPGLYG
jgi:hypothetical protein